MRHVAVSVIGEKGVARDQTHRFFRTVFAIAHLDLARDDDEDLGAVIHVPDIGLVAPVQPHARPFDQAQINRAPGAVRPKLRQALENVRHGGSLGLRAG